MSEYDIYSKLSKLTGKSYENIFRDLNSDSPKPLDPIGNLNINEFNKYAISQGVSSMASAKSVSNLTGSSFESSYLEMLKPNVNKLKTNGLSLPGHHALFQL